MRSATQQQLQNPETNAPLESVSHRETKSFNRNNDVHINISYAQKSAEQERNLLQEKNANPLPSSSLRSPHSPVCVSKSVGIYGHKALQQQLRHHQQRQSAAVGERRSAKPLKLNLLGFSTSNDSNDSTPPISYRLSGAHYGMDRTRSVDSAASAASESTRMADTSSLDSEELVVALPAPRQQQQQLQHGNEEAAGGSVHMALPQLPRTPRFPKIGFSSDRCDSGYRSQETTATTCATGSFSTSFQSAHSKTGALVSAAQSFQSFDHQSALKRKKTASTKRRLFVARGRLARGSDQCVTLEGPQEESEQSSSLSPSLGDGDGSGDGDVYADELEPANSQCVMNSQHQLTTGNGGSGPALTPVKRMLPPLPDLKAQGLSPDVPLQANLHALSRSPRRSLNIGEESCTSPTQSKLQWPLQPRECPKSSPTRRKLPTIPIQQQQHGQAQQLCTTASSPGSRDTLTPSSALSPTQRIPRETSPQLRTYSIPPPLNSQQRPSPPCLQLQLTAAPSQQYRNTYELGQTFFTASRPEAGGLAACGGGVRAELPVAGLPRQWTLQVPGAAEATATTLSSGVYGRWLHSAQEPRTTRLGSYYGTDLLDPEAQQSLLNRLRSRSFDAQAASNL